MKRTKIICTIGPASDNEEMMTKLAQAGMNMIRLNFSHGTYDEQLNKIKICKRLMKNMVGILNYARYKGLKSESRNGNDCVHFEKGDKVRVVREND